MRFTVIENFFSEETKSEYVAGLSYTVRERDEVLRQLLPQWIAQGKVREGASAASMTGSGNSR